MTVAVHRSHTIVSYDTGMNNFTWLVGPIADSQQATAFNELLKIVHALHRGGYQEVAASFNS